MSISLLLISAVPAHAATIEQAGFVCTAADGSTMRLNIDLRKRRFDDGSGWKALYQITDTQIEIRGSNPDLLTTPMGPVFASLTLDRATLVLTDQSLIPDRNINRTVRYQCVKGPIIDFTAGRQF
jgi:hypothetical protein